MIRKQIEQEPDRMGPRELNAARSEHRLEQLLSTLLGVKAEDLIRHVAYRLERADGG